LGSLIFHESTAMAMTRYDPLVVDGLLQTPAYARIMIGREPWRTPEEVEACVRIRLERQRIMQRQLPARFTFFVHEQALRWQVGDPAVMHDQMLKLVLLAALDHVKVRVVPEPTAFGGEFYLFRYQDHPSLVYLDSPSTGLFLEDKEFVEPYRRLTSDIAKVALDEGQSREFIAELANEYDRGSESDVGDRVEEEQH